MKQPLAHEGVHCEGGRDLIEKDEGGKREMEYPVAVQPVLQYDSQ